MRTRAKVTLMTLAILIGVFGVFAVLGGMGTPRHIQGRVLDFDTGKPMASVRVQESQDLGLNPDAGGPYLVKAGWTDQDGLFRLNYYQVENSVQFSCSAPGYVFFFRSYQHDHEIVVRLRRTRVGLKHLHQAFMHLRRMRDGTMYGWDFSHERMTASKDSADILPTEISMWGFKRIKALGTAGVQFISEDSLGVDGRFLNYADWAPPSGYRQEAEMNSKGGIYFVRTRDGRFVKIEFNGNYSGSGRTPPVERRADLRYYIGEVGSRDLRSQDTY